MLEEFNKLNLKTDPNIAQLNDASICNIAFEYYQGERDLVAGGGQTRQNKC